ncbi:hypothetical protein [Halovivax gelatinilyticus]|uniref:hypothetical protein n=1 Tax=Halovivax gelatinilyticus TaxID=2961597 RepID=UPI0020CA5D0A|nr:hypothetical protein [Halovivax gelatinilyticus]
MAREIRITIDDDEVFERMKARKQRLDLSWEDVLHRGLRREPEPDSPPHAEEPHHGGRRRRGSDPISSPGSFAEDLKHQIQNQVRESLSASVDASWSDHDDWLDTDVSTLERAEDAVLSFDFLGDDAAESAYQVPLRVTLEASADGLQADVVAVRQGRTVSSMNAFDASVRRRIVEGLATGEDASLVFDGGAEVYRVRPRLSWSRSDGRPTVIDVAVDEVRFDDD